MTAPPTATATWAELVDALVEQCAGDPATELAPLLGDGPPDVVDGRARLHPYLLRADVHALLGWLAHLDQPPPAAVFADPVEGGTRIRALGSLCGEPVELVAVTHRPVPRGRIGLDELRPLADRELVELGAARST